jgi:hypothetical protein
MQDMVWQFLESKNSLKLPGIILVLVRGSYGL